MRGKLGDMTESDIVWSALILAGAAYEVYALASRRPGDTLSETTRGAFRVRSSRLGRTVFLVAWLGFSGWFTGHVLDWWA